MADQFLAPITAKLADLGYANVLVQGQPQEREWHEIPLVVIAPEPSPWHWHAFNEINNASTYGVYYIDENQGKNILNPALNTFKENMKAFHGLPTGLEAAGAWNVVATHVTAVDRSVFGHQFDCAMVRLTIHWISEQE